MRTLPFSPRSSGDKTRQWRQICFWRERRLRGRQRHDVDDVDAATRPDHRPPRRPTWRDKCRPWSPRRRGHSATRFCRRTGRLWRSERAEQYQQWAGEGSEDTMLIAGLLPSPLRHWTSSLLSSSRINNQSHAANKKAVQKVMYSIQGADLAALTGSHLDYWHYTASTKQFSFNDL